MLNTTLSREAARRLRNGASSLQREDIISMTGTPHAGEPVQLVDEDGVMLGLGDVDLHAARAVRRLGLPDETAEGLIPRHVRRALEQRAQLVEDPRFCRLIHDDGDGLPGLVVDRYDQHFVVQTLTRAMDSRVAEIARALVEVAGASSVLLRNDGAQRGHLGLDVQRPLVLAGAPPRWCRLLELGARFTVDLNFGASTGYRYEHRELRKFLHRLSHGARVLDPSCNVGGLFVHAGLHGAREILAFERDPDAAELARENAEANGLLGRVRVETGSSLAALAGVDAAFDLVLLDTQEAEGAADFSEQVKLALRATRHGGRLMIAARYGSLGERRPGDLIAEACSQEGRTAFCVAWLSLPPDFPTVIGAGDDAFQAAVLEVA